MLAYCKIDYEEDIVISARRTVRLEAILHIEYETENRAQDNGSPLALVTFEFEDPKLTYKDKTTSWFTRSIQSRLQDKDKTIVWQAYPKQSQTTDILACMINYIFCQLFSDQD